MQMQVLNSRKEVGRMWVWALLIRGLVAYLFLRVTVQLFGLKRVSESDVLSLSLIFGLTVFLGLAALGIDWSLLRVGLLAALWVALVLLERYAFVRSSALRRGSSPEPTVLVYRGKLLEHNLYRKRVTIEQLLSKLRSRNAFRLADVELAILEPDGSVSVMRTPQAEPLTRQDMLVTGKDRGLEVEVICDGQINHRNLKQRRLTEKWLRDHLRAYNVEFVSEVALATVDENNDLYVDKYDDGLSQCPKLHPYQQGGGDLTDGSPRATILREKPVSRGESVYAERQLQREIKDSLPEVPKKQ